MKNDPDFDFSDEPADLVPDNDPEVLVGMKRAAMARAAADSLPESSFGR